ncbi:hypothetical protein [Ralstonia phage RP31]|uniref:Polymerase nucleotidyl transferase domain-containing protein n=2 Tax=Ripduovirus RP12 TaxID=2560700 RepID=A0A1L7N0U6_9CAUD|nr:hypothetical protein FDH28_gp118 [Ralstonia phage RP12]BAW19092.1 hypothetical protein [Ralstonia phage RP12]BAW19378.1 hypothetical protein [Ralstonia phage RP31]
MLDNNKEKLAEASVLVSRHLGLEVVASAIHGSMLRGFNDPNSDIDMCFLLNRPVSDYINMTNVPFFEGTLEERRKRLADLSTKLTHELGWPIMVSILDMRSLLRGIMNCSTFSLMAYESFAKENERIKFLFDPVAEDYFCVENLVFRCAEHITKSMHTLSQIQGSGLEFKQERTYLGILWSAHRVLAYIGGDKQHCRTVDELITLNIDQWGGAFSEGFQRPVLGVIRARVERSPFVAPQGVSEEAMGLLQIFTDKVLQEATDYVRKHPRRVPTRAEETREMIDLYQELLNGEDQESEEITV